MVTTKGATLAIAAAAGEDFKNGRRGDPAGSGVFKVLIYMGYWDRLILGFIFPPPRGIASKKCAKFQTTKKAQPRMNMNEHE